MKNKNLIITLLLLTIVAGGAFFGGMKYQQSKQKNQFNNFPGNRNFGDGLQKNIQNDAGNRGGYRPVAGKITLIDDKSVTVKLNDGSSKIVILSGSTTFSKTDEGSLSDLKVGENINVFGTTNSDGSLTAQNIQIGAMFRGLGNTQLTN